MVAEPSMQFLENDGAMSVEIRSYDWESTALGAPSTWPRSLKTAVGMVLASKFPMCVVWGADLITIYNDAYKPILGSKRNALGRAFDAVWSEAWDCIAPIAAKAFAGEATYIEDFPLIIERRGFPEQTYFTFCYSPIRNEGGQVAGFLDTVVETTAKVNAERSTQVLNQELEHRLRNTLAMVAAIANQTFRSGKSTEEMQEMLLQRIAALGRAHEVLTGVKWNPADLRSVITNALAPHRSGREQISIEGPELDLSARHALSLALAIHELATNAAKYGALTDERGRIDIRWHVEDGGEPTFHLTWIEHEGPTVPPPARYGFGSRLLKDILPKEFNGTVQIELPAEGFRCELTTPLHELDRT